MNSVIVRREGLTVCVQPQRLPHHSIYLQEKAAFEPNDYTDCAMSAAESLPSEAYRVAIEAITKLVYAKKPAAELVLRPCGIPEVYIARFLTEKDPATGKNRSKREMATIIVEELGRTGDDVAVVRALVALAADWKSLHLAQNEFETQAVVEKARRLIPEIEAAGRAYEAAAAKAREDADIRRLNERQSQINQQSPLLLAMFDHAAKDGEANTRGYLLEDLLNRTFDINGFIVRKSFRRNEGGEQIDGAFEMDSWHFLVECRWRKRPADIRQIDGLAGQISRSGKQTLGLFLSIEGWSENVISLLKQSPHKSIMLMHGGDFRAVLEQRADLRALLKAKVKALNLDAEPYLSVSSLFSSAR